MYGYDTGGAEGYYDGEDFSSGSSSSKCSGSGIVYGPTGCSGCCSGYDGEGRDAIQYLQNLLVTLGYLDVSSVTGQYGSKTYAAVQQFQKDYGLLGDGRVGSATLPLLKEQADARRTALQLHSDTPTAPGAVPALPATPAKPALTEQVWFWPAVGVVSALMIGGAFWWRANK